MQKLLRRIVYIFRHRRLEAELAEEMEFHRSMLAHLGGGGFGNATLAREDARAVWLPPSLESVWQDVVYAVRMLWREPAFALLAIGALTAGIGLNSSLFTVYSALALKPWAVRDSESVVRLSNNSTFDLRKRAGGGPSGFAQAELDYFMTHATTISGAVTIGRRVSVRVGDADTDASWVGGTYFTVLGVDMTLGRGFVAEEDRVDSPTAVAVLSHGSGAASSAPSRDAGGRSGWTTCRYGGWRRRPGFLGTTRIAGCLVPWRRRRCCVGRSLGARRRPAAAQLRTRRRAPPPGFTREQARGAPLLSRQFRARVRMIRENHVRARRFRRPKGDAALCSCRCSWAWCSCAAGLRQRRQILSRAARSAA